jgi:hypothetical protein
VPGLCRARTGLATGERPRGWQRQEDAQKRPHRDGGVAPRAPSVVLVPELPFGAGGVKILAQAGVPGGGGGAPRMDWPVRPHQPARLRRCASAANAPCLL